MDTARTVCSSGFRQCRPASVHFPHETTAKRGETKWSRVRIQVGFTDHLKGCFQPGRHGKPEGCKSSECLKDSQCQAQKPWQFISTLTGSSTGLPSCHGEGISIHLIPSPHCHLKLCDLPILAPSSQKENLEWGCPGQSCSGL